MALEPSSLAGVGACAWPCAYACVQAIDGVNQAGSRHNSHPLHTTHQQSPTPLSEGHTHTPCVLWRGGMSVGVFCEEGGCSVERRRGEECGCVV